MSARWPVSSFEQRTCPKCGAQQQSLGSTVCEQCGTDLRAGLSRASSSPSVPRLRQGPRASVQLLKRAIVVLLLGSLAVGLTLVPEVSARVPALKPITTIAQKVLRRAEVWGGMVLADLKILTRTHLPTSPPAATSQKSTPARTPAVTSKKSAPARAVAVQPLTVKSTPIGAAVQINARPVGKTPLTLKLAPGTYKVTISRPGYVTVTRTITVKAGNAASLNLALAAAPPAPAQVPPAPPPPLPPPNSGGGGK